MDKLSSSDLPILEWFISQKKNPGVVLSGAPDDCHHLLMMKEGFGLACWRAVSCTWALIRN